MLSIHHNNTAFAIIYCIVLLVFMAYSFGRFVFQDDAMHDFHSANARSDDWNHRQLLQQITENDHVDGEREKDMKPSTLDTQSAKKLIKLVKKKHAGLDDKRIPSETLSASIDTLRKKKERREKAKKRKKRRKEKRQRLTESEHSHGDNENAGIEDEIEDHSAAPSVDAARELLNCFEQHLMEVDGGCAEYPDYLKELALPEGMERLPIYPQGIRYLGVLLDAGRQWYPIQWIKNLLDILSMMNFNFLHFRLTDDQVFNVRFDSHPKLATAAGNAPTNTTVYTTAELRELVAYAKDRNITIMPEINMPGHAGGWAGEIPYLVVPCSGFICQRGYGLPLNMTHVGLYDMLRDIISETRSIFYTSPYLHLGGDELHMSQDCFTELGLPMDNYTIFEDKLREVVSSLGIEEEFIVRWETTGQPPENRVGKVVHWWESLRFHNTSHNWTKPHVFVSKGLYFDTNEMEDAFYLFGRTEHIARHWKTPIGVVAGTFELGPDDWHDRNILGRLLAVAMGASDLVFGDRKDDFDDKYMEFCNMLKFPQKQCMMYGVPPMQWDYWRNSRWSSLISTWRRDICNRLTDEELVYVHTDQSYYASSSVLPGVISNFWDHFGEVVAQEAVPAQLEDMEIPDSIASIRDRGNIPFTGITLDITRDMASSDFSPLRTFMDTIDFMVLLGFNMIHLHIMDDISFAVDFDAHPRLANTVQYLYTTSVLKEINSYAQQRGVTIMPEISVSTRAGGWRNAGYSVPCPQHVCDWTLPELPTNPVKFSDPSFLAVVSSVLSEFQEIFGTGYLHLGYNDRSESMICFSEAKLEPDFDAFEAKLDLLLEYHGYDPKKVVRWEEYSMQDKGTRRAGMITHYIDTMASANESHFASTGIMFENQRSMMEDGLTIYHNVLKLLGSSPTAVLAWVGPFSRWDFLSIRERLLAIAIGLSRPNLSPEEFSNVFKITCEALPRAGNTTMECDQIGRVRQPGDAENVLQLESNMRREKMCNERTRQTMLQSPKKGVLVPLIEDAKTAKGTPELRTGEGVLVPLTEDAEIAKTTPELLASEAVLVPLAEYPETVKITPELLTAEGVVVPPSEDAETANTTPELLASEGVLLPLSEDPETEDNSRTSNK
jgi:hypothetical protein